MKYSISHQIYAATRRYRGFGIFYQSPTLSHLDDSNREVIKRNSVYCTPVDLSKSTDLSQFPFNLAYYNVEDKGTKKTALLFSKYTGATNHTPDRQGNFLSHTIIFEGYLGNICIPEILKQLQFQKSLTIEEETTFVPPSEELEYEQQYSSCIQDSIKFLISAPKYQNTLLAIIDEIIGGWLNTKGHNITINALTNKECINLIFSLYSLIPAYLINKYSFTTYTYNPSKISYQISGIIPECKVLELNPEYFKIYDVEKYAEEYSPKWEFTKNLKVWITRHDIEGISGIYKLLDDYQIEKLDENVDLPFRIETFKKNISTKQISDLNDILQLIPLSLSSPKKKLIEYVRLHNNNLFFYYQIQEMKEDVKTSTSIINCINIIERYIKMLGNELNDNQLLNLYKDFEQTVSQWVLPAQIAIKLLTSKNQDIRAIFLKNTILQEYLFNSIEINWDDINNKEISLKEYEVLLNEYNKFPKINLCTDIQRLENDISNGVFFDNIESHEGTLSKLKEKDIIKMFSKSLEFMNDRGELSYTFLDKAIRLINSYFAEPLFFWNNYFSNKIEKVGKEYRKPYSNKWSYSLIKRCLILHVATSDNHQISKYEGLYNKFDEYECRWVLERLNEIHNREGYNTLLSLLPKEKKKIFGIIWDRINPLLF